MTTKQWLTALIVIVLSGVISAYADSTEDTDTNLAQTLQIEIKQFEQPMLFNITLPPSYNTQPQKHYFVLFDLHPRSHAYLSGLHDWLSHNGEWPWLETIVVNPADYHKEFAQLFEKTAAQPDDHAMLDVIETDILAAIDAQFRTNGFRIFSGFMSNGAIGLYALLNRPALFDAYFIASPTLNDNFLGISADTPKKIANVTDKLRFLYVTIGSHNYEKAHADDVLALEQMLKDKAPQVLDWRVEMDDAHYYMSRPVFTVLNGIETLFDDYHTPLSPESAIASQGVDAIVAHYKTLSEKKYGFEVSAETSIKALAKHKMDSAPDTGIKIYQQAIALYPESAYAYADLASAYKQLGDTENAIAQLTIAVEKSASMNPWHQKRLTKRLNEYKQLPD